MEYGRDPNSTLQGLLPQRGLLAPRVHAALDRRLFLADLRDQIAAKALAARYLSPTF